MSQFWTEVDALLGESVQLPEVYHYITSPQFLSIELTDAGAVINTGDVNGSDLDIANFTRVLYYLTNGKFNNSILQSLSKSVENERTRSKIVDTWQLLMNIEKMNEKKSEPMVKPSQVIKKT